MQPGIFAAGDRAVALIIRHDKIVLIRRLRQGHEYYVLPGGSIEPDETPVAACIREVAEETGLIVAAHTYLCTLNNQGRHEHYFLVEAEHDILVLGGPECQRYRSDNQYTPLWVHRAQIPSLNIQPRDVRQRILTHLSRPV